MQKIRIPIKFENCLRIRGGDQTKKIRFTIIFIFLISSEILLYVASTHEHFKLTWNMETNVIYLTN